MLNFGISWRNHFGSSAFERVRQYGELFSAQWNFTFLNIHYDAQSVQRYVQFGWCAHKHWTSWFEQFIVPKTELHYAAFLKISLKKEKFVWGFVWFFVCHSIEYWIRYITENEFFRQLFEHKSFSFCLLIMEIDPIVKAQNTILTNFMHKDMLKTAAAKYVVATWVQSKPEILQKEYLIWTSVCNGSVGIYIDIKWTFPFFSNAFLLDSIPAYSLLLHQEFHQQFHHFGV